MSHTPEIAAPLSGGGFSNFFLRESYQNDAVQFYLRIIGNKYKGFYKCVPLTESDPTYSYFVNIFVVLLDVPIPISPRRRCTAALLLMENSSLRMARAARHLCVSPSVHLSEQLTTDMQIMGGVISLLK